MAPKNVKPFLTFLDLSSAASLYLANDNRHIQLLKILYAIFPSLCLCKHFKPPTGKLHLHISVPKKSHSICTAQLKCWVRAENSPCHRRITGHRLHVCASAGFHGLSDTVGFRGYHHNGCSKWSPWSLDSREDLAGLNSSSLHTSLETSLSYCTALRISTTGNGTNLQYYYGD